MFPGFSPRVFGDEIAVWKVWKLWEGFSCFLVCVFQGLGITFGRFSFHFFKRGFWVRFGICCHAS